jgi:hypothetical protein
MNVGAGHQAQLNTGTGIRKLTRKSLDAGADC